MEREICHSHITPIRPFFLFYFQNDFHCFEHASHVLMSVVKLLSRIVAPKLEPGKFDDENMQRHDHTYGITSDPLTQFAVAFSALIHDVDHSGVPNTRLIDENPDLAALYKNRSVAEQNSLAIALELLEDREFRALRNAIYSTEDEMHHFRELVVNSVLATDIVDKELKAIRNDRWKRAFDMSQQQEESERDQINRKATIVIEHLLQASDVSHTMQHWHVYTKWNRRFFLECYKAYLDGRAENDPSVGWYKGEIGFFDFYIIPLAKKLKECGVFGVSSDEFLDYATHNRAEWVAKGEAFVAEMKQEAANMFLPPASS